MVAIRERGGKSTWYVGLGGTVGTIGGDISKEGPNLTSRERERRITL